MCLCSPHFKAASERGYLQRAIDEAARPCPDGFCVSAHQTDWLTQFALRFPFNRELRRDVRRKQQVYRWFVAAGEDIPDSVEWFWRPDGEIGVARFCTVRRGTQEGYIHALRVRDDGQSVVEIKADQHFLEAIDWARQFVVDWLGESVAADRVRQASVKIDRADEPFEDRSVALAALVAFASLALRFPVNPDRIFTGIPAEHRRDVAPPDSHTLVYKLRAVPPCGAHARLVAPPGSGRGLLPHQISATLLECNWQGALCEGLGKEFHALEAEARKHGVHPQNSASQPFTVVLRDAIHACLFAALPEGITLYQLELCFDQLRKVDPRLNQFSGSSLHTELAQLQRARVVVEQDLRWRLQTSREPPSPLSLEQARQALAVVLEQQGQGHKALEHRAALRQVEQVAKALESLIFDAPRDTSQANDAEARLTQASAPLLAAARQSPALVPAVDAAITAARRLPRSLLRVALRCGALPAPFASLADAWGACTTAIDRLLWLQSVTETALHLLVALGSASMPTPAPAPLAQDLANQTRRPSLGVLSTLAFRLLPPGAGVFSSQDAAEGFARSWNDLLHHPGAWRELHQTSAAVLEAKTEHLARGTLDVLDRLQQLGGPAQARLSQQGITGTDDPELIIEPTGAWLLRRGVLDGQVRYWAFDRLRYERRPVGAPVTSLAPFPLTDLGSTLPALNKLNTPLDYLPTPVAEALLQLKQSPPHPLLRLACIDEATHWLLRLAMPGDSATREAAKKAGWLSRRHKRAFLETIQHIAGPTAWPGDYLRRDPGRRLAFDLVGLLERLEHGPAPVSAWAPWIELAWRLLGALIKVSPWAVNKLELFKLSVEDPGPTRLVGLHPTVQRVDSCPHPPGTTWLRGQPPSPLAGPMNDPTPQPWVEVVCSI